IVLILISVSVITDMIGIAVVASNEAPFKSMILKKVRGARQGLFMVQNAAKIASLCADVIGDVCGVLSGAAGVTILSFLISDNSLSAYAILLAAFISAIIAGLTIGGKALIKQYATNNAIKIILIIGKFLSLFSKEQNKK
ncbi:MAG: hypothetical protein PHX09_00370, partial [Clostridia bacterium]|nr:hypothetical protein [Clostridia bacterium]